VLDDDKVYLSHFEKSGIHCHTHMVNAILYAYLFFHI